jgi:PPK2 family polyphosphate:nucleotide phosphotransferase
MQQLSKLLNNFVDLKRIMVEPGKKIALEKDFDPGYTGTFKQRQDAEQELLKNVEQLATQQDILYASHTYALLLVFQAMDAAGKDGTIKHVMSGVNPQGCQVFSFKSPSAEELNHDYLWRTNKCLPERGRIGIFNRSYYEELLVVRVHSEFLSGEHLPAVRTEHSIWKHRFEEINNFELYLTNNGIIILKFFLNVSKKEQKKRFLTRIEEKEKNWKFSANDIRERRYWAGYMAAYEDAFNHTSTEYAPWFVIPADHKWYTRLCVSQVIVAALQYIDLKYPKVTDAAIAALEEAKKELLESED